MTTIHNLTSGEVNAAFERFKDLFAITSPKPVKPKVDKPTRVELKNNWRAWAFGPVAIAGAVVSALRTAAAAVQVAAVTKLIPWIPPQFEAIPVVVAVDVTIVIGMLVLAYSRLQNLKLSELKKEMEQMRFLKLAVILAVSIALIANVTQVISEQFESIHPRIAFVFDLSNALAFSVGMVFLALIGSEQLAYLLAWTRLENLELERVWKRDSDKILDAWRTDLDEWESKVVRSWHSQKSKILGLTVQDRPSRPTDLDTLDTPDSSWSKDRKKGFVFQVVAALCSNGHKTVTYQQVKDKLGAIPRASFYLYVDELVKDGRLEKGPNGRGWRKTIKESF